MNQPPTSQPLGPNQPQNPYPSSNQQFYNYQTQAYPQHPPSPYPYTQQVYPQQPNPYQQPPQQQYPPYQPGYMSGPPAPPAKPKRPWLIGCGVAILALLICGLCSSVVNATNNQAQTNQASDITLATPTVSGSSQKVHMTTYTPTPKTTTVKPIPTSVPPTPTPLPQPIQVPTSQPTQAPAPQPTQASAATGVNGNPWGYDFNPGTPLTDPDPGFCDSGYFQCVTTFWKDTNGYVVQCSNGLFSHSGGIRGACSRDGGPAKTLYFH